MQQKDIRAVNKIRCHSKLDLESSTHAVSQRKQPRQSWKTLNQVQGDDTNLMSGLHPTYKGTNAWGRSDVSPTIASVQQRGFTLIELLVVVLIIGILAAVALPQYQRAVEKSRATQAFTIVKSLAEAQERYFLANGEYATSFDSFDIDIPGTDATYHGYARKKTDYFDFGLNTATSRPIIAIAQRWEKGKVHVDGKGHYAFVKLANDPNIYCTLSSGGLGDPWQICKTLSGGQMSSVYSDWYVIRP